MHYKDRTYCSSSDTCDNKECADRFTEEDARSAAIWWNGPDAPISMINYKNNNCGFVEKGKINVLYQKNYQKV